MAAPVLTAASTLLCPHGGTVTVMATGGATVSGVPVALSTDAFPITGCPFQIPVGVGTVPHPCVSVIWISIGQTAKANGVAILTAQSIGLCIAADGVPQGPVIVAATQPVVTAA